MKNTLLDIHNMLVATLEDLDDPELLEDETRCKRMTSIAKAKTEVVEQIVEVDRLSIEAAKISHSEKYDYLNVSNVLRLGNE